jgi:hypothetical protein
MRIKEGDPTGYKPVSIEFTIEEEFIDFNELIGFVLRRKDCKKSTAYIMADKIYDLLEKSI